MHTHIISVSQQKAGAVNLLDMVEIWLIVRCFSSFEVNFRMGTITEGFVFRLPAPAEGILFLKRERFDIAPGTAVSLGIITDLFYLKGDISRNAIRTVFDYPDFLIIM